MHRLLRAAAQVPWKKIEAERVNKDRTPEEAAARTAKLIQKDKARAKRIAAAGIEYEYEPLEVQRPQKATKITFD
jgi:nucleolar protein 15